MRCVVIQNPGPDSQLHIIEAPMPVCGEEHILVKVHATALNRADLLQREGKYPPPADASPVPGLEVAGEIIACGANVTRFTIGELVYGLVAGGAYATHCLVHQNLAETIPQGWDMMHAAALPEALVTVHSTVFLQGQLAAKQHFLIHAAGSGISSLALQMARFVGATTFTTVSNTRKMALAQPLADTVINYKTEDFANLIAAQSLDVIVDFIGGDYFAKHMALLKPQGRLLQIACLNGHRVELNLAQLMQKRLQVIGFVLRSQTLKEKTQLWQSAQLQWGEALRQQHIKPIIDSTFSFNDIEKAQRHMRSGANFGKIVILMH